MTDKDADFEYVATFEYPDCTCAHDAEEHSYGQCGVDNCSCEAGWVE